ncbi:MAG: hypothetical protein LBR26_16030 [Prevotella sp.]|jgi:hypothetical protein|nr:hypothetical protein [Prevotella sp.]
MNEDLRKSPFCSSDTPPCNTCSSDTPPRNTCHRSLEYHFTDKEKEEMGKQLAFETQSKRNLEDQKKAVTSQYGSQINEKAEVINTLSDKIASGYEYRNIECEVLYHTPAKNKKTLIRQDNGQRLVESMTEFDHNLFTQYQEKLDPVISEDSKDFQ